MIDIHTKHCVLSEVESPIVITPDKGDRVVLFLGVNKVTVHYVDGDWTIVTNTNIKTIVQSVGIDNLVSPWRPDFRSTKEIVQEELLRKP